MGGAGGRGGRQFSINIRRRHGLGMHLVASKFLSNVTRQVAGVAQTILTANGMTAAILGPAGLKSCLWNSSRSSLSDNLQAL
eukprot:SAG11_NODE_172_length_13574_cov_14.732690_14_plen_82_part_00